jgi:magnesium chelatase family protein
MPALVGGGAQPRPGEISLAHHGVLFLDELPEFERRALEALREPLETGHVTIARASRSCHFPARFQLVAAMNPCPCGYLGHPMQDCRCTPERIAQYRARLSGPLLDRIDLHVTLSVERHWLELPPGDASPVIRERVRAARDAQYARQGCLNARLDPAGLEVHAHTEPAGHALLMEAIQRWGWSARATQRILRVARTLADLAADDRIRKAHVSAAMRFRPVAGFVQARSAPDRLGPDVRG